MGKFPIPYSDYRRIFSTIYSILHNEDAELNHSCLFFSIFGAFILNEHYKIKAYALSGVAALKVGEAQNEVLCFGEEKDGIICSSEAGFHSWIETDDWIIDFSAPQFPELLKSMGNNNPYEAKMFQKHISDMSTSPNEFEAVGDFYFHPDIDLTKELVDHFIANQLYLDLGEICYKWYRKPPKKMQKSIPIADNFGNMQNLPFKKIALSGTW